MRISILKHILATAAAATLAAASCQAFAQSVPFPGTTVFLSPLATIDNPDPPPTERVIRLPPEAGVVTRTITTNFLDMGPSWLVQGDKVWSICAPRRTQVACSPIAQVSTMRDIHIRAYAGVNNLPTIAYDVMPYTKRTVEDLMAATFYFQSRLKTKVAHFNRYTYTPPPKKGEYDSKRAPVKPPLTGSAITTTSGAACSYSDDIAIECYSTDGGGDGIDAWQHDWTPDTNWIETAMANPPPPSAVPSYPDGPDNASADPCNGCQQVVIMGSRPQTCVYSLFGAVCSFGPPVVVTDPPVIPDNQPWFSQSSCDRVHVLCTRGQVPVDNERIPSEKPGDYEADTDACLKNRYVEEGVCFTNWKISRDGRIFGACMERASNRYTACLSSARDAQKG
jgi:hypothetical protein